MLTKVKLALKSWKGWRAINKAIKEESKMGKKWWESKQFWGVAIKTGAGLLTACGLLKSEINDAALQHFADSVPVVLTGLLTGVGQVLEVWGKRKHAEAVAVVSK